MPFPIRAIQVDGGSEFKAGFEAECQRRGIDLFELPPRSPELNGHVERNNGAWRYEFYATWELPHDLDSLNHGSTPSQTSSTPSDRTTPLADKPPNSTLPNEQPTKPHRPQMS